MAKTFYTERDIDELHARGVTTLDVNDDVVLTDLARERCDQHGIRLIRRASPAAQAEDEEAAELAHRVKAAVIARLGDQVDAKVLDAVVARVVKGARNS
jgi:hypothetical protein